MQPLPHHYQVTVSAAETGRTQITSPGLTAIASEAPPQFDGSGNFWSPETLTVAAVADCLVLTFRAVAKIAKLRWATLVCNAHGTVDRSDGVTRFTEIELHVRLEVPAGGDVEKARRILEKAENACLVGNSLRFQPRLQAEVTFEEPALAPSA